MTPRKRRSPSTPVAGALATLVVVAIFLIFRSLSGEPARPAIATPTPPDEQLGDWYSIYFTDPAGPAADRLRAGPDADLAKAINQARLSVDVAIYQLNLWSIRDALLAAHRRGVAVRLVTDSDYLDEEEVQELITAGIPVLGDRQEGFMHNKFVVIDRQEVWTGSMNLSVNDAYRNNNNLVRIRSQRLAQNYTAEFEEMFTDDLFGPGSRANTAFPTLTVNGTRLEVFFSPEDGVAARLAELIGGARHSIYFLAFSFTSDELAAAIVERASAGLEVAGVIDEGQHRSNQGGELDKFLAAGLEVALDANPKNMHHKVIIIDKEIIVTGSYNFSWNAEQVNDENVLILHSPEIAAKYWQEFEKIYELATGKQN